jgi:ribonuclease III
MDIAQLDALQATLGRVFLRPELLDLALTHASVATTKTANNERLEFLGDAVLGLVVCEQVFELYPEFLEGEMTKIKSTVVSRQTCAVIAREMGLDKTLVLGKGMRGELPASLAAAALEAVIGAIFLDGGYAAARDFLRPRVAKLIEDAAESGHQHNFKSVLQQHAQQTMGTTPTYRILAEEGPDHAKVFTICVELGGKRHEPSRGQSKKRAEQDAAMNALRELGIVEALPGGGVRLVGPAKPFPVGEAT